MKRACSKMVCFGRPSLIKFVVTSVLYIIILYVYLNIIKKNKHGLSQFHLTDKTKLDIGTSLVKGAHRENRGSSLEQSIGILVNQELYKHKHGENKVDLDHGDRSSGRGSQTMDLGAETPALLNIYVVEEHHEVIPYWFGAAERGLIPKQGNTLIHIDGHNDMGPPSYLPGYPFFRWPRGPEELRYLMQRNDAFIQAAAMTGLITRSVWVWPTWDRANHGQDYSAGPLSLGWFRPQKHAERLFCMCSLNTNGTSDVCITFSEYGPYEYNVTDEQSEKSFEGFPVPKILCRIEKTIWVEEIVDTKAAALFGNADWRRDQSSVILDVDEDYFGCSFAVRPLLDSDVSVDTIEATDMMLGSIFCPKSLEQERESDRIFQEILFRIRKSKICFQGQNNADICRELVRYSNVTALVEILLEQLLNSSKQKQITLCSDKLERLKAACRHLLIYIITMKSDQIKQLQYVGFCSDTSPLTMIPDVDRHFGICSGANSPNMSVVPEHLPRDNEITLRSRLLKKILEKVKPLSPKLATVCRSVRDGYTPRNMFEEIERVTMQGLGDTFDSNITYDNGLMGGKAGWPVAHWQLMQ